MYHYHIHERPPRPSVFARYECPDRQAVSSRFCENSSAKIFHFHPLPGIRHIRDKWKLGFRSSVEILCYPPRGARSGSSRDWVSRGVGGEAATGRESERRSTTETHRSAMNKMITKKNATSMIFGGGKTKAASKKKAAAKKTTPRKTGTVRQVRPRTRRRRWERREREEKKSRAGF